MKLAKYLADCLATGIDKLHKAGVPMDFTNKGLEPIIQHGIEAYLSTENIDLLMIDNNGREVKSVWTVVSCHGGVVSLKERASDRLKIMLHDYDIQDMDDTIHDYDQDEEGVYQEIEL